jgi:hypothetical protein
VVSRADLAADAGAGFVGDFEETLRRTDKVQPALLVAAIVSAAGFALTTDGSARVLASVGAAGFVVTLAASTAILVPLQRRIVATPPAEAKAIDEMRAAGFAGTSAARCSRRRRSWRSPCRRVTKRE